MMPWVSICIPAPMNPAVFSDAIPRRTKPMWLIEE
jgi:hypothetical protein